MAIDRKYGRVTTEKGTIGDDEPVVVFRAQDILLLNVLSAYRLACGMAGCPPEHIAGIDATIAQVREWQENFFNYTQIPQSKGE